MAWTADHGLLRGRCDAHRRKRRRLVRRPGEPEDARRTRRAAQLIPAAGAEHGRLVAHRAAGVEPPQRTHREERQILEADVVERERHRAGHAAGDARELHRHRARTGEDRGLFRRDLERGAHGVAEIALARGRAGAIQQVEIDLTGADHDIVRAPVDASRGHCAVPFFISLKRRAFAPLTWLRALRRAGPVPLVSHISCAAGRALFISLKRRAFAPLTWLRALRRAGAVAPAGPLRGPVPLISHTWGAPGTRIAGPPVLPLRPWGRRGPG